MSFRSHTCALALYALVSTSSVSAQVEDMAAAVPAKMMARTADDQRLGMALDREIGNRTFVTPENTLRLDLLNSRGKVKQTVVDISDLELAGLRPGVWTLRAHTAEGILVRRFMVMRRGSVLWTLPNTTRRSR